MTGASVLTFVAAVLTVTGLADLLGGARANGQQATRRAARAPRLLRALARLGRRLKPAGAPAPRISRPASPPPAGPVGSGLAR